MLYIVLKLRFITNEIQSPSKRKLYLPVRFSCHRHAQKITQEGQGFWLGFIALALGSREPGQSRNDPAPNQLSFVLHLFAVLSPGTQMAKALPVVFSITVNGPPFFQLLMPHSLVIFDSSFYYISHSIHPQNQSIQISPSVQNPMTSHLHCCHSGPWHLHFSPDYCNNLLEVLPAFTLKCTPQTTDTVVLVNLHRVLRTSMCKTSPWLPA